MRIKFQTELKINEKEILKDCMIVVPQEDILSDIRNIVILWAEERLKEDGWPVPVSAKEIREYLLENGLIIELDNDYN